MLTLVPSAFAATQGTVLAPTGGQTQPLLPTGGPGIKRGPAIILPAAAALLLGSEILAYTVFRRR
jgi:hypothetical protein